MEKYKMFQTTNIHEPYIVKSSHFFPTSLVSQINGTPESPVDLNGEIPVFLSKPQLARFRNGILVRFSLYGMYSCILCIILSEHRIVLVG